VSARLKRLDAVMRETFNCSFDGFMREVIDEHFDKRLKEAHAQGYREGLTDGLQRTHPVGGGRQKTVRRGHPSKMDPGMQLRMALEVDKSRAEGMFVKPAVDRFLHGMRLNHKTRKEAGGRIHEFEKLPTLAQAVKIYFRTKEKGKVQQLSLSVVRQWSELRSLIKGQR
jgi:hypothetical protein